MRHWPTSSPHHKEKNDASDIDNPVEIISNGRILTLDWIYWIYAWSVVISDPGSYAL